MDSSPKSAKHPIAEFRERMALTQEEFARRIGVTGATVSRWESGERSPRLADLKKLHAETGIPVAELLSVCVGDQEAAQ